MAVVAALIKSLRPETNFGIADFRICNDQLTMYFDG